jgi:hypothetical protein
MDTNADAQTSIDTAAWLILTNCLLPILVLEVEAMYDVYFYVARRQDVHDSIHNSHTCPPT